MNNVLQLICRSHTKIRQTKPEKLKKCLKFDISWLRFKPFNYVFIGCSVSSIHQKPVPAYSKDSDHASAKVVTNLNEIEMLHSATRNENIELIKLMLSLGLDIDSKNSCGSTPLMVAASSDKLDAYQLLMQNKADRFLKDSNGWSLLHCAAQGGNTSIINELLRLRLDINLRSSDDITPLMVAAYSDKLDAYQLLMQNKADPYMKDNNGWSLLHCAAQGGNTNIIKTLLPFCLDINSSSSDGITPLMVAAYSNKQAAYQLLMKNEANPCLKDYSGWSLLHFAAKGGNTSIIKALLQFCRDINSSSSDGITPLMIAASHDKPAAYQLLMQNKAEPSLKDYNGWSLLHFAAKGGNTSIINELLSRNLEIDSRSNNDITPLMVAASHDKPAAYQLLIQHGADPVLTDKDGFSLLHKAAEGGNTSIIEKLLSLGLNVDLKSSDDITPLMVAANSDKPAAYQLLMQNKAEPSLKDYNGWSLLHFAAKGGNTSIINELLSLNYEINSKNSNDITPLMVAASHDKPAAYQLLIQHGADPVLTDKDGFSLLHKAAEGGSTSIIEKLLSLGLCVDLKSSDGITPLMVAAYSDKPAAYQLLMQNKANPSLKDNKGCSLLHSAVQGDNTFIIENLLSLGLDINSRNKNGSSPLMISTKQKKLKAKKYLISKGALRL